MICPHCKKEIKVREITKDEILLEIKKEEHSITSLSNTMGIRRSTLNYYLKDLINEKKIYKNELKNITGRPVILSIRK